MRFELHIPTAEAEGLDIALRVEAQSWIQALKTGLTKLGEQGDIVKNIICDIQDDGSIHVTDPKSRRVFRIRPLDDEKEAASKAPPEPKPPKPETVAAADDFSITGRVKRGVDIPKPDAPVVLHEQQPEEPLSPIGRVHLENIDPDELIAMVFEESQELHFGAGDANEASEFMMDLAMKYVEVEAGSVLLSDINRHELVFSATRGPKAAEIKHFRVPIGMGIVGFCAQEGISLAVSDVNRDPRFYARISQSLGFDTRSILCVPIEVEGRNFGAIELINKKKNNSWTSSDMNLLIYMANQLGEFLSIRY